MIRHNDQQLETAFWSDTMINMCQILSKDKEREDDEKSVESAKNKSTELTETVVPAEVMTVEEEKKVKKKAFKFLTE
jgi:hypothetical protein